MTTPRARKDNGTRAFERLLDATTAQTKVMTSVLEVQRVDTERTNKLSETLGGLGGLIEKQTTVLEAMREELVAGLPRTAAAVKQLEVHVTTTSLLSDGKFRAAVFITAGITLVVSLIAGGAGRLIDALFHLPH